MIREKKKSSSRRVVESSSRHDCPLCKEYFIPNEVTRKAIGETVDTLVDKIRAFESEHPELAEVNHA